MRTVYSTRCEHSAENLEFATCREAEDEARRLAEHGEVQVVKIVVVATYRPSRGRR